MYQETPIILKWFPIRNIARYSLVLVLTVTLLSLGVVGLTVRPVYAWTSGACTSNNGVTVVVDFGHLGGGTTVRCAPGSQSTGVSALRNAGFGVTNLSKDSAFGFFVCRINGQPSHADEKCLTAPPRSSYWSYWHASRGGSWTFSSMGAGSRTPPAGSVEGWRFGGGGSLRPSAAPPAKIPSDSKPASPIKKPSKNTSSGPSGNKHLGANNGSGSSGGQSPSDDKSSYSPIPGEVSSSKHSSGNAKKRNSSRAKDSPQSAAAIASGGGKGSASVADMSTPDTGSDGQGEALGGLIVLATLAALGVLGAVFWRRRPRDN